MEHRREAATICAALALVAAAALFAVRGPMRAHRDSGDLKGRYLATRAWVRGADPYDAAAVSAVARQSGLSGNLEPYVHEIYPPSTFVVLAPLALFEWPAARDVWVLVTLLGCAAVLVLWPGGLPPPPARIAVAAFVLAFAPLHTGIALGNVTVACAAMIVIAVACWMRGRDLAAAILLGVAIALKPQLALPFLFVPFAARRWRSLIVAMAIPLAILAAGVSRLPPQWPHELAANYASVFAPGDVNDPTPANRYRFNLVNLTTLLYSFTSDPAAVQWTNAAVALVLGVALLVLGWRRGDDVLVVAAATAALSLLPLYRRMYDAAVLLLPFAWCVPRLRENRSARIVFVALLPFLVPGAALLRRYAGESLLWNAVVMPHAIWCEIAISIALLIQLRSRS